MSFPYLLGRSSHNIYTPLEEFMSLGITQLKHLTQCVKSQGNKEMQNKISSIYQIKENNLKILKYI
jgi:hypothetical protein